MQELEAQLAKAQFARRHFTKMASIGFAALIARVAMPKPAKAQDNDNDFRGDGDNDSDDGGCFLKGTRIRTVAGERKIEDIAIGDLALTPHGPRPITAISHFVIAKPWPRVAIPARIARSALADGVPHTDLFVSQGHAIVVDGEWLTAQGLVNGRTIAYARATAPVLEYFHVKLQSHDCVYANGALCESQAESVVDFYAPVAFRGRRSQIASHFRSALSPWVDRRTPADVVRDRLEDRASCF
jgi:hypothetical protein